MNSMNCYVCTSTDPSLLRIEQPTTNPDAFRSALVFQRLLVYTILRYTSTRKLFNTTGFFEMDINL